MNALWLQIQSPTPVRPRIRASFVFHPLEGYVLGQSWPLSGRSCRKSRSLWEGCLKSGTHPAKTVGIEFEVVGASQVSATESIRTISEALSMSSYLICISLRRCANQVVSKTLSTPGAAARSKATRLSSREKVSWMSGSTSTKRCSSRRKAGGKGPQREPTMDTSSTTTIIKSRVTSP